MIQSFVAVFQVINIQVLISSALLFFVGYAFAPTAYYKKIKWLTAYPFFIIKIMDVYFKKAHHPLKIFAILFFLNTTSLFINLLSAWGIILPVLFVMYMGINIGVVMYHSLEGRYYYLGLINPVALLELPAAWLSIALAIQFSLTNYFNNTSIIALSFEQCIIYFLHTIIPLLLFAGVIETVLIAKAEKSGDTED